MSKFNCKPCNYHSDSRQLYKKHLKTNKHKKNMELEDEEKGEDCPSAQDIIEKIIHNAPNEVIKEMIIKSKEKNEKNFIESENMTHYLSLDIYIHNDDFVICADHGAHIKVSELKEKGAIMNPIVQLFEAYTTFVKFSKTPNQVQEEMALETYD